MGDLKMLAKSECKCIHKVHSPRCVYTMPEYASHLFCEAPYRIS